MTNHSQVPHPSEPASDEPDSTPVLSKQPRRRGWPLWAWAVLVLVTALVAGVVALFALLIAVSGSTACGETPDPRAVEDAQHSLAVLAGVAAAPWLVLSIWLRPRFRLVVAGLVCAAPAMAFFVEGAVNPSSYSLSWCFG
jgi:hypothetical protein